MFVLTVDQIDSQHTADLVDPTMRDLVARHGTRLVAAPERTAGDEFQLAAERGGVALDIALGLVRTGDWSVGLGAGAVTSPPGSSVRAMSGSAFVAARDAVTLAKKRSARFAFVADDDHATLRELDPLIRLLLALRERRTPEGWELFDLLEGDPPLSVTDAAHRLGITVQAASQRSLTAGARLDREARDALESMLDAESARIGG